MNRRDIDIFLKENELYGTKQEINDSIYVNIDIKKTDISSFYSYNENSENECWRRFVVIGKEDELNIIDTTPTFIHSTLKQVLRIVA